MMKSEFRFICRRSYCKTIIIHFIFSIHMAKKALIQWLKKPETHDYPAAATYLSLLYPATVVKKLVANLQKTPVSHFKAKDIFRASSLSLLWVSNWHVKKDMKKINDGIKLSPLLLVRSGETGKLIIADGYHRLCAVYKFDEDAIIPCKIC